MSTLMPQSIVRPTAVSTDSLKRHHTSAARIAIIYLVMGLLWIWLSDTVLTIFKSQSDQWFLLAASKGTLFVLLSALLIYWLLKHNFRIIASAIKELKNTEHQLSHTTGRLQALMNALPVGVSFSDDTTCQRITGNPVVLAQFQVRPQENLSASAPDPVAPGRQVQFFNAGRLLKDSELPLQRAVAENRVIAPMELEVILPDGRTWFAEASGAPIQDDQGQVVAGVAVTLDITERRRFATELREKEFQLYAVDRRLAELVKGMTEACFTLDRDWRFTFVNDRSEELLHHRREQLIGKVIWEVFDKLVGTPMEKYYRQAMAERRSVSFVVFSPIAKRWLDIRLFPTPEGLAAFLLDVHDRKLAEEGLRISEERFRSAFEYTSVAMVITDTSNRFVRVNNAFVRLFGYTENELLKMKMTDLVHPDHRSQSETKRELLKNGSTVYFEMEKRYIHRNGNEIWGLANVSLVHDENGQPSQYVIQIQDITDRKKTELALRESEARYARVVRGTNDGIWDLDLVTGINYFSPRWKELLDYSTEELPNDLQEFKSRIHPEDVERVSEAAKNHLEKNDPFDAELRVLTKSGEYRWFRSRGLAERDIRGTPIRFSGSISDISEQKDAEAEIRRLNTDLERRVDERTAELHEAQRLARVGSWVWDANEDRVQWTTELYRIFGLDPDEPAPAFAQQESLYSSESWVKLNEVVTQTLTTGIPFEVELTIRRADGSTGIILGRGEMNRDSEKGINCLRGTVQDITQLREAEAEVRKISERLLLATKAGNVGIWDWNIVDNILTWDDAMYALYGITSSQFAGAYEAWQAGLHPDDRERASEEIQQALRREKDFDTEFRVVWTDQSVHDIRAHGVVYFAPDGTPIRMLGTNWDITAIKQARTEIKELNEDLTRRNAQVTEANKELEAFSYSVSHDLRAPLRAIDGFSRILIDEFSAELSEEAREYLLIVRNNTQQMGKLVDDLLEFSRLNRHTLMKRTVAVDQLVQQCISELAKVRSAEFRVGELPPCLGDPSLLKQVWLNLIDNALKYSKTRTPAIIEIRASKQAKETVYSIKDNGVGFDMRYAHKLFGVFQRLHRQEDYDGTGVGLAIVQRVILRHGGRVWADACLDAGATFSFSLPIKEDASHE